MNQRVCGKFGAWVIVVFAGAMFASGCGVDARIMGPPGALSDREARDLAKSALDEGRRLRSVGDEDAALDLYERRARETLQGLRPRGDARMALDRALRDAGRSGGRERALAILEGGLEDAILSTRFSLSASASLPEGFPEPSPPGRVRVKSYPSVRMVICKDGQSANAMFRPLFGHIKRNDIPMTAPVSMGYSGAPVDAPALETMAFCYPTSSTGNAGPDGSLDVVDAPPMTVVSLGVRGTYTPEHFAEGLEVLREWLAEHADLYAADGPPRLLAYHSPMVLWFRRYGEVQVPVREVRSVAGSRVGP
jgi:SOUL heme-binding protein